MDSVKELLIILISSSLVSNVVLSQFLGLCPFLGVSKKIKTAAGMGMAVIFVITGQRGCRSNLSVCSGCTWNRVSADHCVYSGDCSPGTVR